MFDPNLYLMDVKGHDYLPVNRRVQWFRDVYPTTGCITTEMIVESPITFRATIMVDGSLLAIAHASKRNSSFSVESTETAAIGRALALAGFGTQFTDPTEDDDPDPVDAPIPPVKFVPADGIKPEVWKRWDALLAEAHSIGIDVDDVDRGVVTLKELTSAAGNLKVMIAQTKLGV